MALYFKDIEIINIDNLVPQTGLDITDLWFGETNVYTVWQTYEGALPATLYANGADMRQYQIYGNTGGVGDKTVQLFDISSAEPNKYINPNNGAVNTTLYNGYVLSDYIYVAGYNAVTISSMTGSVAKQTGAHINCYDNSKNWIRGYLAYNAEPANTKKKFVVDVTGISYIRVDFATADLSQNMLTSGTASPETFVPFGYEVDMGVKSAQMFDKNAKNLNNGYMPHTFLRSDGSSVSRSEYKWYVTEYINVSGCAALYCNVVTDSVRAPAICFYDGEKNYISGAMYDYRANFSVTVPQNAVYCRATVYGSPDEDSFMIAPGSTPLPYQPYFSTVIPIYIGDEPLDKDEYVDYQAGKVFRRTAQLFDKSKYIKTASTYRSTAAETQTGVEITSAGNDPYVGVTLDVGRDANRYKGNMIKIAPEEIYTISASALPKCFITYIDDDYISLGYNQITSNSYTFTTPANCSFVLFRFGKHGLPVGETFKFDNIVFLKGNTAAETYIPYLQPADPPVPLPALPTCEGTTVIDYAGQSVAPEKVLLKYRKEGF